MEITDEAPRLPKLPFLLGDVVFLGAAYWIASRSGSPPSPAAIGGVVICVGIGVALAVAPFLMDYLRAQAALVAERQNSLEALARTTSAAADQASIAVNGLQQIADTVRRLQDAIEDIPPRLQEAIDRAEQVGDPRDLVATQLALQRTTEKLGDLDRQLGRRIAALADVASSIETPSTPPPPKAKPSKIKAQPVPESPQLQLDDASPVAPAAPASETVPPKASAPLIAAAPIADEPSADEPPVDDATVEAVAPVEEPEPPDDPVPESSDDDAPEAAIPVDDEDAVEPTDDSDDETEEQSPAEEEADIEKDDVSEPTTASPDGAIRLTVTAYIGIGNRLFVRGDGPGLTWDEGTPLQFVSIGKWRWETDEAAGPVKLRLYKNDQIECSTLGELTLKPGQQREVNAAF